MRHSYQLEGEAYRLRPIVDEDADFIVALRGRDVRARFLNRISLSVESQLEWLSSYYQRENDYYFVVEKKRDNSPEGLISLYDVDVRVGRAEWGRWIVAPASMAALESVMLLLDFAFTRLSLGEVYSNTIAGNAAVNSFHDGCGFRRGDLQRERFKVDGQAHDAIRHECTAGEWREIRPRLATKVLRIAKRVNSHA
jgi:RimJ/RimL family protein N-acetyltransferase